MANAIKWEAVWTSRSTVLGTELNSRGSATRTDRGTEVDNSSNLDQYGKLEINVTFGSAPTAGGYLQLHMLTSPAGASTYESGSNTVDPGAHTIVATVPVQASTSAQRLMTPMFRLEPARTSFILYNGTSQAFPSSGSTVTLYTSNDEIQ